MDIEEKHTPSHLASVFADILNPDTEIKAVSLSTSKRKKLKRKKNSSSTKKTSEKDEADADTSTGSSSTKSKKAKREWDNLCRSKPDAITDREFERSLIRIATKGVVQLFNAIREHQSRIGEAVAQSGTTSTKMERTVKDMVKKDNFLDLVSKSAAKNEDTIKKERVNTKFKPKPIKKEVDETETSAKWDVLRDDFLMNSTKDWDKDN